MNNEIGRKITSLTLMTIMVAGGMTFAFPGMVPAAHAANANLFVSAENSQFDNYMSGPQVIEVVVIDSDINETDEANGEPDVTVNGKILRMVQAVDGNWYGYFADATQAERADDTTTVAGEGLDFGAVCTAAQGTTFTNIDLGDTDGVAFDTDNACGGTPAVVAANPVNMNVVREAKEANISVPGTGGPTAPTGFNDAAWPFIQLYDLNPTGNVVVQYNKGGGVQTTTLTFDTAQDFAGLELDRSVYGQAMEVHATITDLWLNIDPTDEDSWTFAANAGVAEAGTYYQVFDENGNGAGDAVAGGVIQLDSNTLDGLMCDDNCLLFLTPNQQGGDGVVTLQDNDDSDIVASGSTQLISSFETATQGALGGAYPITVTEQGPNSGVFSTSDEGDVSSLIIVDDPIFERGQSATIDYNDTPVSILTGYITGSVDIQPIDDEWSSGEAIPVVVDDHDLNLNSRADEDLDLFSPTVDHIPTLETGSPITLETLSDATLAGAGVFPPANHPETVEQFSDRAFLEVSSATLAVGNGSELILDLGSDTTFEDFYDSVSDTRDDNTGFSGVSLINYDVRSIFNNVDLDSVDIALSDGVTDVTLATDADSQGLIVIDGPDTEIPGVFDFGDGDDVELVFTFNTSAADTDVFPGTVMPIVVDFFSFGFIDDGEPAADRVANQIIRLELEESGDNTGLFEGELEYTMINQLNILDEETYEDLSTIADDPTFIVIEDLTDEDAPRVNYLEIISDGLPTIRSDQEEAPSHSAVVSFDQDNYKVADTVTITLEDQDLNTDSDLLEIYTTVSETFATDPAFGTVGEEGLPVLSFGPLGGLLDVTFDDVIWKTPQGTCDLQVFNDDTGLDALTFSLVETSSESGVFKGEFEIPDKWCRADDGDPETTTGLDIEVNYVDFRDASGEIIEVGDSAGIRANTGSISLDRTVYPVPFGVPDNFASTSETSPDGRSVFPIHQTGVNTAGTDRSDAGLQSGEFLSEGDLQVHLRVNDPDFDVSGAGENFIEQNREDINVGLVEISVIRGSETVILGYAGGPDEIPGTINVGTDLEGDGIIELRELEIIEGGADFDDGLPVTITQAGRETGSIDAEATFTDDSEGILDVGEIDIITDGALFDEDENVLITGDTSGASVLFDFDDINEDMEIAANELVAVVGTQTGTFDTLGEPVTITQTGATDSTGTFTDEVGVISLGDGLDAITPFGGVTGGTGFVGPAPDGAEVTISQAGATDATAIFRDTPTIRQFGPIEEISPASGIFELDLTIRYTDGPADALCPDTTSFEPLDGTTGTGELSRFSEASGTTENYCILQGDILQVEYEDPTDASGDKNTVTDSATFDLRNGVLQSDKSVYIIGSDIILTLIEPDLDLDNDAAETFDLDLIEWDSDAATVTMGDADGVGAAFDPEPSNFRETGDSTGIFQIVIETPEILEGDRLERGEEIILEYTDWGPSGSDYVGDEDEDVNLTLYTSNFGATVELDQKVYSWTDKAYLTIVAPDHNFDSDLVDEIGESDLDPIKISTRGADLDNYKLVETGTDTGIFTGEVILTGFTHDADGDTTTGDDNGNDVVSRSPTGSGPTDGLLPADDDDGLTVSFEFSEDETVVGSALIRWNIGEVQWLEASYPASGTGVVRIIDPDMNLDPEAVDNFDVDVWSDSDAGGIDLTVTETNEATGIFEGTVFFTVTDESSGHRLRVAEGDTVTAEYEDNTLPDPYTTADELDITSTSLIGTVVPPLERAPIVSCSVVDAFGNTLSSVSVDQQVQITCDLANGQDREQQFAYLVQIQDANGVTVQLAWITGSLAPGQSFSPAQSWIPEVAGSYDATAFVWESVDNPTALSPPVTTPITVN